MMLSKNELHTELQQATEKLIATISGVSEDIFNNKPAPEKWSAAEAAEHIYLTELLIVRLLRGKGVAPEREPDANMIPFMEKFADLELKLTAFGPIIPNNKPKEKADLIKKIEGNRSMMAGYIDSHDLSELLPAFKHPLFGELTRYEWIQFNIHHGERHRRQIERVVSESGFTGL